MAHTVLKFKSNGDKSLREKIEAPVGFSWHMIFWNDPIFLSKNHKVLNFVYDLLYWGFILLFGGVAVGAGLAALLNVFDDGMFLVGMFFTFLALRLWAGFCYNDYLIRKLKKNGYILQDIAPTEFSDSYKHDINYYKNKYNI